MKILKKWCLHSKDYAKEIRIGYIRISHEIRCKDCDKLLRVVYVKPNALFTDITMNYKELKELVERY